MGTAVLIASYGTTRLDTLEKTIRAVERDIAAAFPGLPCYRAFISGIVRARLASRHGMAVDGVKEALQRMAADGADQVLVQPALLIPGEEYDRLRGEVLSQAGTMAVSLGRPLLWDDEDLHWITGVLARAYPVGSDTVLLAMGHGTEHSAGGLYERLACQMRAAGGMALCTARGTPSFDGGIRLLLAQPRRKVHLVPLLLAAGSHSENDMAGEGPDSLRRRLERAGFEVSWSLRGLGELPEVRARLVQRAGETNESLIIRTTARR